MCQIQIVCFQLYICKCVCMQVYAIVLFFLQLSHRQYLKEQFCNICEYGTTDTTNYWYSVFTYNKTLWQQGLRLSDRRYLKLNGRFLTFSDLLMFCMHCQINYNSNAFSFIDRNIIFVKRSTFDYFCKRAGASCGGSLGFWGVHQTRLHISSFPV